MTPPSATAATVWTIVSQCKSDRVVYFTDDPQYQPPMEGDWYFCSHYIGSLPEQMTLRNCWGWRFKGSQFLDAREPVPVSRAQRLIDNNRQALLRLLRDKIDEVRHPHAPSCLDGQTIRERKLKEARAFLASHAQKEGLQNHRANEDLNVQGFAMLSQVAQSRRCNLLQAAQLIKAKAQAQEQMWLQTERFREQMTQLIEQADTNLQLMELRAWLLEAVYPELSRQFKTPVNNTTPIDLDQSLNETARLHEIARLKSQLRDAINTQRKNLHSSYVLGEQVWQHKLRQAQQWLSQAQHEQADPAQPGFELLAGYAQAQSQSLSGVALQLLQAASNATQTLIQTERRKDELLARIDALQSMADVQVLDKALRDLATALPLDLEPER